MVGVVVGLTVGVAKPLANHRPFTLNNLTNSLAHYAYSIFAGGLFPRHHEFNTGICDMSSWG